MRPWADDAPEIGSGAGRGRKNPRDSGVPDPEATSRKLPVRLPDRRCRRPRRAPRCVCGRRLHNDSTVWSVAVPSADPTGRLVRARRRGHLLRTARHRPAVPYRAVQAPTAGPAPHRKPPASRVPRPPPPSNRLRATSPYQLRLLQGSTRSPKPRYPPVSGWTLV